MAGETETTVGEAENGEAVPLTLVEQGGLEAALGDLPSDHAAWARTNGFTGRLGQWLGLPGAGGVFERILVGWGDAAARRREIFPLGGFAAAAPAGTYRLETALGPREADAAALGWLLARYRFDRYKRSDSANEAHLLAPEGVDGVRLGIVAEGVYVTRDLINTPANDMGPEALETAARKIGERHGATVSAITGDALLEENLPLIHTVGRASARAPRLIELAWGPEDAPRVTLVGKGVCFDTGGLDLKSAAGMHLMKKDMGGAATVLGLAHMVMGLALPVRLRVLIPAVENAVSGNAMRPGDVLRARSGLTVEVNNTDAEGRLVLADALTLAAEEAPEVILDMATLTGAARVALGPELPAMFTDDEALAADLAHGAAASTDPIWRLPLWPGYERLIEPKVADLDNAPSGGMAGAITAALFLKRFVGESSWAHFDVYGWSNADRPGRPKGGDCQAARACLAMLESRYGR
ncbi:leucyl aminopeptidase family protein [Paralimibaculum aggregatum]|uniref:Leucyl aminopeptidase family protein n=1 Tax=Paralimibaculum aggregatum TaxID=3036245 RepID=A0ABQ6LKF3_9RHOB|nr:leucyl aminopeptidase family protein [Limibaculum sp. NKW23]GMG83732.1 leucyl aminopeptidase family protein [Limibaculum sp. NKW23]